MIRYYRSSTNDDTSSNGGAVNYNNQITSGALDNVFPSILEDEREGTSITRYRKIFAQYSLLTPSDLQNTIAMVKIQPDNDDIVYVASGSSVDTQGDISGYTWHGSGNLGNSLSGGVSDSIFVETKEEGGFHDEDLIFIGEISGVGWTTPYFEVLRCASATYYSISGGYVLSGITNAVSGSTVRRDFSDPDNTVVCSCIEIGSLEASAYDIANEDSPPRGLINVPTVNNIGCINEEWTLEFQDDDGNFTVEGASQILTDTTEYSVDSETNVINYRNGQPYFSIASDDWFNSTAISAGDVITFKTQAPSFAIWCKLKVGADAPASYGVYGVLSVVGE